MSRRAPRRRAGAPRRRPTPPARRRSRARRGAAAGHRRRAGPGRTPGATTPRAAAAEAALTRASWCARPRWRRRQVVARPAPTGGTGDVRSPSGGGSSTARRRRRAPSRVGDQPDRSWSRATATSRPAWSPPGPATAPLTAVLPPAEPRAVVHRRRRRRRARSVLELVNPDAGPAVADVTVYGAHGLVDVARARGLGAGRHAASASTSAPDRAAPRRARAARGGHRAAGSAPRARPVDDSAAARSRDWLPPQAEPATTVPAGPGRGPGRADRSRSPTRATTRCGSRSAWSPTDSSVRPEGWSERSGAARASTGVVDLTSVLRSEARSGAIGLRLDVDAAGHRHRCAPLAAGDLSHAVAGHAAEAGDGAGPCPAARRGSVRSPAPTGRASVTVTCAPGVGRGARRASGSLSAPSAGPRVKLPARRGPRSSRRPSAPRWSAAVRSARRGRAPWCR